MRPWHWKGFHGVFAEAVGGHSFFTNEVKINQILKTQKFSQVAQSQPGS